MRAPVFHVLVPALLFAGCEDTCGHKVIARSEAPDARHSAVLFEGNCGATAGFATHVAVIEAGENDLFDALVFHADDRDHQAERGEWGGPMAKMEWLAPDRLRISYSAGSHVLQQKTSIGGIAIEYSPGF